MSSNEALILALLEGDITPMIRFVRTLSEEDLAKFLEGTSKLFTVIDVERGRREERAAADGSYEDYMTAMEIIGSRG